MEGRPDNSAMDQDERDHDRPPWQQMPRPPALDTDMRSGNEIDDDLMRKVMAQQQLLEQEKQREAQMEAQQKMMGQQQLAMLEQQRMPGAQPVRSSGVSLVSAPIAPPGVVIPQVNPGQQQQMGGPPPLMSQDINRGGPQGQGGPSMMGQPMSSSGPQGGSQGGPPMMGQPMSSSGPQGGSQGGPPSLMSQQINPSGPPGQRQQGGPPSLMQGAPPRPMQQMGDRPPMPPGGPQGGPRPLMQQGAPQGPPPMQQIGDRPPMGPRGPQMSQGGPGQQMQQMGDRQPMQQGGPNMPPGGPNMQHGGPPMQQGRPPMNQGGPPMQQGGPPMSQSGPQQGGPGGPHMSQGGHMQDRGQLPPPLMGQNIRPPGPNRDGPNFRDGPPGQNRDGPNFRDGPPGQNRDGPNFRDGPPGQNRDGPNFRDGPPGQNRDGPNFRDGPPGQNRDGPNRDRPPFPNRDGPQGMNRDEPQDRDDRPNRDGPPNRGPPGDNRGPPGDNRGPPGDNRAPNRGPQRPYNGPNIPDSQRRAGPPPSSGGSKEIRLPQALEKMLEFKTQRETETGVEMDPSDQNGVGSDDEKEEEVREEENDDSDEEVIETGNKSQTKESKNKRRKKKKKKARKNRFETQKKPRKKDKKSKQPEVIVEYIQEQPELDPADPNYHTFAAIFETFKITEPEKPKEVKVEGHDEVVKKEEPVPKAKGLQESDEEDEEEVVDDEDGPKISKKKLKKLTRLTVAQLKQLVTRPDVVEMHDVTARDPRLLVHLKATRNSVPVPRHWCYKRKYLQGKRGIEKTPFELPDFIKATGIEEMRAALQEKEDQKTLKSKMREKVRPKMGKIDIDYQKLHDAFFRFQTKPKMTVHGDLYYESKEFETKLREKKPGNLSDDLKLALGMPIGANSERVPPPWLIAMQRYGPPPSYPNLKIAGLNAPIPEGCMFGYHAGGWGKPPVDEHGKPLYGDVFGTQNTEFKNEVEEDEVDDTAWGELESESESESESEEEEEEAEKDETGLVTPAEGLMTPGGITSVPLGMETPDQIELRKRRIEDAMDQGGDTPALYQVLPEKKAAPVGSAMMGSAHVYDIAAAGAAAKKAGDKATVEVSLDPEELDLDTNAMQAKFDQTLREQAGQLEKEDLSDMVAAHAAKQRKRKKAQADTGKTAKKYKDFKF